MLHQQRPGGSPQSPGRLPSAACWAGSDLGEVELQGVICGQGDHEATGQVLRERVPVVAEEQAVVAERGHGNADLSQVIQVLQDRGLDREEGWRTRQGASMPGGHTAFGARGRGLQARCHRRTVNPSWVPPLEDGWEELIILGRRNLISRLGEEEDQEGKQLLVEAGGVDPDLAKKQPVGDVLGQHEG